MVEFTGLEEMAVALQFIIIRYTVKHFNSMEYYTIP